MTSDDCPTRIKVNAPKGKQSGEDSRTSNPQITSDSLKQQQEEREGGNFRRLLVYVSPRDKVL